jgi:hypothetical protein
MPTTTLPITTRLISGVLCLAAAAGIAGPVASAHAEDNGDNDMSKEEACYYLQDGYERASAYASEARANGDMAAYEYWSNLATEIYLDAEFDWECDFAAAHKPPKWHFDDVAPPLSGEIGPVLDDGDTIRPPRSAIKTATGYERWLESDDHVDACRTMKVSTRALDRHDAALAGDVIEVAAHFGDCTWAKHRLPALTVVTAPAPEPPPASSETPPPPVEEPPPPPPVLL